MAELQLGGILLVPAIVGLVQLAKYFGLPPQYAPLVNMILTAIAVILVMAAQVYPQIVEPAVFIIGGLVLFLANCGFYETARFLVDRRK